MDKILVVLPSIGCWNLVKFRERSGEMVCIIFGEVETRS